MATESPRHTDRVKLNVGGTIFLTSRETLGRYGGTLLAELNPESESFDNVNKEYYFNRDPAVFTCVLNLYRTRELHISRILCGNIVKQELAFWRIPESLISPCCWRTLHQVEGDEEIITSLVGGDGHWTESGDADSRVTRWRRQIWNIMEHPNSSFVAKVWSCLTAALILLASITYCLDTMPELRTFPENGTLEHAIYMYYKPTLGNRKQLFVFGAYNVTIYLIDLACLIFFTVEVILRFLVCLEWRMLFRSFEAWVDVMAVVSGWVGLIYQELFSTFFTADSFDVFIIIRSLYVVRLFRIIRLLRNNTNFRIIILAVKDCWKELVYLMLCFFILAVIFGSVEYFCEEENTQFRSIPVAIWWALVTMTTVGYGDIYPTTYCGYFFGSVCAFLGTMALCIPTVVIANHFKDYYSINLWRVKYKNSHYKT